MKILIIEDDLSLSDVIAFTLRRAGFAVLTAYDGLAGVALWEQQRPDLIVLDLNLPKLDGLAVCRQIRTVDQTPIIMLSVRNSDDVVVKGLELGADDYVVKPFSPTQLVARIRAVLRRTGMVETPAVLTIGDLTLDRARNELKYPGAETLHLTQREARLLEMLMLHPSQVLTTEQLINQIWGADGGDRAMLKQLVYRLRGKIEQMAPPFQIETVVGMGYSFITRA